MESKTLTAHVRTERKKASRKLRKEGKIPAVIYGREINLPIYVDEHEFNTKFHVISENTIITLKTDGEDHDVLVKDYQEDVIKGKIIHIDFYAIEKGKLLRTHVPVELTGAPEGVKLGGILETLLHEVEIECLPKDLPDKFVIDISDLGVGDSVHVSDIPVEGDIKIVTPDEQVVCTIALARAEKVAVEGEEEVEEEAEVSAETESEE